MSRRFLSLSIATAGLLTAQANDSDAFPSLTTEFFDLNCYECHNPVDQKGELDLESLQFDDTLLSDRSLLAMIHDRVRDGEMPPKEDSLVEPEERRDFLTEFEAKLHDASTAHTRDLGRVKSRRLSRVEYENTLHDLFGINIPLLDLLPEETGKNSFFNNADGQQISYHLLQKYLIAIDLMLDESFKQALEPRVSYYEEFEPHQLGVGRERIRNERMAVYDADNHQLLSFPTTNGFHGRMPDTTVSETGWYRVTVTAKAHNAPAGRSVWTRLKTGILRAKAPMTYWVGHFEATDELRTHSFDTWIRAPHQLGIRPVDKTIDWVNTDEIYTFDAVKNGAAAVAVKGLTMERIYPGLDPADLQKHLFGDLKINDGELQSERPQQDLADLLLRFANRAFRRSVTASELEPYVDFANTEMAASDSLLAGVRAGYRAILCSHRFIYFAEEPGRLDDYAIASRLSYFLWSTSPDPELRRLAEAGKLSQPHTLVAQVERMLDDDRSQTFVKNFSDSWLNLNDINFTTPDDKLYPEFDPILLHSMLEETHGFLSLMIQDDLSVTNVIDSDFTMVNERLAHHYGLDFESNETLQKLPLAPGSRRGGILTHASVLKVTANGTTTSPIVRGAWLLERILGKHIPPPPDQVPAIEPDIRGAVSIRDQMDKHRSIESCMGCHKKIDPPGFALENYDVIGGWRDNYRAKTEKDKLTEGQPVDASYAMADGRPFDDVTGFKKIVLTDPEQITRNVLKQVLTYATGAEIEFGDRREINQIVSDLAEHNYGFRSLILAATQSDIFLSK
ncbi:DUF1592 domain-containing protein [Opitutaceae bacterium]|nr:DUF1592 domain-containing protein [Opitutaceae bacterium]